MQDLSIMGRIKNDYSIEVVEGLYIRLNPNAKNPKYLYSFTLKGQQHRASTKTNNEADAKLIALKAYTDAKNNIREGKTSQKHSFKKLCRVYLQNIESTPKHKFHKETIARHFAPFFDRFDNVSTIRNIDIDAYLVHRRAKVNGKVKNNSINKENVVLRNLLVTAVKYNWVADQLSVVRLPEEDSARPHFTEIEYLKLTEMSRKRMNEYLPSKKKKQDKGLSRPTYWSRALLHDIIIIISNTGLRVDEIKTVRWKDINFNNETLALHKKGKVKAHREVVMRGKYCIRALERIKERRINELKSKNRSFDINERVQSLPNGTFVHSLGKGFRELINVCDFDYSDRNHRHTLTSLRHTYATLRLTDSVQPAGITALALQMGTSTKMIEKHYNHAIPNDFKSQLRG